MGGARELLASFDSQDELAGSVLLVALIEKPG
jgi:hypothetical protein